jgi:hypothetical protein
MFDSKYLPSGQQPTARQLDKLRREGIHGGRNFLTWFREHVNPDLTSDLSMTCIMFNHLTYLIGSQCVLAGNVHADLCQLSYRSVDAKSYSRYEVNGFCFRSTIFEASYLLAATTNIGIVTRSIDVEGHKSKYYGIIKNIIEYNFVGIKNLKTMFFDCDWFIPIMVLERNEIGMVEVKHVHWLCGCDPFVLAHQVEQVYYMSYPCEKLSVWWVVYRVNQRKQLHIPDDSGYHKNQMPAGGVDEVYQDDELPRSFNIDPGSVLNSLLSDTNDVTVPEQRK